MAYKALPPQDLLNQLFRYEAETGKLYWRERPASMFTDKKQSASHNAAIWNGKNAGNEACSRASNGYLETSIFRRRITAHRIIWKLVTGVDPDDIDHQDGDGSNNRWANLRDVNHETNGRNLKLRKNNTSGVQGVALHTDKVRWIARINPARRTIYLGLFNSFDDAVAARRAAEVKYGFHENHGRR